MHLAKQSKVARKLERGEKTDREDLEQAFLISLRFGSSYEYIASITVILNELGLVKSKSEAKRLIDQGAIEVIHENGNKTIVYDDRPLIQVGDVIKVGKRRFVKIVDADEGKPA